jgi:hypothetical protein
MTFITKNSLRLTKSNLEFWDSEHRTENNQKK